jgi:hypothetical protein
MNKCILYKEEKGCNILKKESFKELVAQEKCGNDGCPFYKTFEEQVEQERKAKERLENLKLGIVYKSFTGEV